MTDQRSEEGKERGGQQSIEQGFEVGGHVSSDAIEHELARQWREAARSDGAHALSRASVLTLIVYTPDRSELARVLDTIVHLSGQHPSRAIVLLADMGDGATASLRAWVSTHKIDSTDGGQALYGEQIIVEATGYAVRYLPSLTDQLMIADLPSVLWWAGDLPPASDMTTLALTDEQSEGSLFDRLTVLADRLIVDSAEFRSPIASMAVLSQVAHRRHQPCIPGDLNWGRLTYWRDQVAQFFDPPNSRPYLDQLDRIAIGIAAAANGAVNPAQAFLLTGWLASRLGWRPSIPDRAPASPGRNHTLIRRGADGVLRLDFQVGLRQVRLAIHPGAPDGTLPGGLSDVTLSAGRDALFRIARQDDGVHAVAEQEIPDSAPLRRTVRLEPVTPGQLLAEELGLVERDVAYDDTLRLLSNLHAMGA